MCHFLQMPDPPRLCGHAHRRVHLAVRVIVAYALHDLEEKPPLETLGEDVEELARFRPVVQDAVLAESGDELLCQAETSGQVEVVIVRNIQEPYARRLQPR